MAIWWVRWQQTGGVAIVICGKAVTEKIFSGREQSESGDHYSRSQSGNGSGNAGVGQGGGGGGGGSGKGVTRLFFGNLAIWRQSGSGKEAEGGGGVAAASGLDCQQGGREQTETGDRDSHDDPPTLRWHDNPVAIAIVIQEGNCDLAVIWQRSGAVVLQQVKVSQLGSVVVKVLRQLPSVDAVFAFVGGGGLIAWIAARSRRWHPQQPALRAQTKAPENRIMCGNPIVPVGVTSALTTKSALAAVAPARHHDGTDDWTIPPAVLRHEYFVEVTTSLAAALEELNTRMIAKKDHRLITKKRRRPFGGKTVPAGFVGVWDRNGRPVIATRNGNYWNFSFRHAWKGTYELTMPIDCLGLTTVMVGQSEAAVVLDPSNRVFIVRNSGFAAFGAQGRFRVVAIVDTLNLGNEHAYYEDNDRKNGRILGWKRDVTTTVKSDAGPTQVTLATFFLVPANNTLILQRGNELMVMKAGQHVITNPNTSFRGFFTLGERQTTFKTQPAYTVEGVPVILRVNLRYQIQDPLLLTAHYDDPLQALSNPAQSAVNSVISRLSYQQFIRAKSIGGDVPDHHVETWLESFKTECVRDLREQAVTYGIIVHSFDVLDRELDLGRDLDLQSEQVLRNQMQATEIGLQNHVMTETQRQSDLGIGASEIEDLPVPETEDEVDFLALSRIVNPTDVTISQLYSLFQTRVDKMGVIGHHLRWSISEYLLCCFFKHAIRFFNADEDGVVRHYADGWMDRDMHTEQRTKALGEKLTTLFRAGTVLYFDRVLQDTGYYKLVFLRDIECYVSGAGLLLPKVTDGEVNNYSLEDAIDAPDPSPSEPNCILLRGGSTLAMIDCCWNTDSFIHDIVRSYTVAGVSRGALGSIMKEKCPAAVLKT
ncbi:hypothetical protein DFJ73DRAFT_757813 [Zopfochytrium polystomum]|nr:hypothetical protein DFJ73DRAFT_757813 [Zopfochytrium polystomum]